MRSSERSVLTAAEKAVYSAGLTGQGVADEFGEEEQSVKSHLRDRSLGRFRGIEDARGPSRAAKARADRVRGVVTEWRRKQPVEAAAFDRHGGFGLLDQVFQHALLGEVVDELQRRDVMLRLDETPDAARVEPQFRRQRAGRPGRR